MLKISLISIGDELCIGQVINTNAAWIADQCTKLGAAVITHSVITDNKEALLSDLQRLSKLSDVIITTGGLGPTHDDITKDILCEYFDTELVFNNEAFANVKTIFERLGRDVTERNKLQAMIPKNATPLQNENGTAPGLHIIHDNKHYFSLPGVPHEAKGLMSDHILDILENIIVHRKHSVYKYKVLHFAGVPESSLADILSINDKVLKGRTLAFLPNYKGIRLRIGVEASSISEADLQIQELENYILQRASQFFIGNDSDNLSVTIGKLLKENNQTLAVAESCTGGMLGAYITDIPGSSNYFEGGIISYSNDIKSKYLDIDPSILEQYGAVSEETAVDMAHNVKTKFNTDFGLSITGIAGPEGGSEEKPVGTVWVGLSTPESTFAKKFNFGKIREINRERAVGMALILLHKYFTA